MSHFHIVTPAAFLCALTSCQPVPTIIPSTQGDHRPHLVLSGPVVDNGAVNRSEDETLTDCSALGGCGFTVFVTRHAVIRLSGTASDPDAGIRSVRLTLKREQETVATFETTIDANAAGEVPIRFGFTGSDNSGGFGLLAPVLVPVSTFSSAELVATNFEGNSNSLTLYYTPLDPPQASISIEPNTIQAGQVAAISISGSPSSTFTITPPHPIGFGLIEVSPSQTTTYTLTVQQPFPFEKVGYPDPPPANSQQTHFTRATAQATLTVLPMSPLPGNPGPLVIYLELQPFGPTTTNYVWANIIGQGSQGALVTLKNENTFPVLLISDSHDSEDCFATSDAGVLLQPEQEATSAEISTLYGTNLAFPRPILACAVVSPSPPQLLALSMTYTN